MFTEPPGQGGSLLAKGSSPEKWVAVCHMSQLPSSSEKLPGALAGKGIWAGYQHQFWVTRHKNHLNLSIGSLISKFPEIMSHYVFLSTHVLVSKARQKPHSKMVLHFWVTVTKDDVQAIVTLFWHSAGPIEICNGDWYSINSIWYFICRTNRIAYSQSYTMTNRWHQKHPHLSQLIDALCMDLLKFQFLST